MPRVADHCQNLSTEELEDLLQIVTDVDSFTKCGNKEITSTPFTELNKYVVYVNGEQMQIKAA